MQSDEKVLDPSTEWKSTKQEKMASLIRRLAPRLCSHLRNLHLSSLAPFLLRNTRRSSCEI